MKKISVFPIYETIACRSSPRHRPDFPQSFGDRPCAVFCVPLPASHHPELYASRYDWTQNPSSENLYPHRQYSS